MAVLILAPTRDPAPWIRALHAVDPTLDIRVWPDVGNEADIDFAIVWKHPQGELRRYPNLRCVSSLGAGVDHLLQDPGLPEQVAITRVVDPLVIQSMVQYIVLAVLHHVREWERYRADQKARRWEPDLSSGTLPRAVGIMGMGKLGSAAAVELVRLGFKVGGWSRTPKQIEGVKSFFGRGQLAEFLAGTQVLVCMLPLTAETRDILNRETFFHLPKSAYLINVARGEHLVEEDLLTALDEGVLSGACLDVFRQEPLPREHPFWSHPRIWVTPHVASITDPMSAATQIVENIHRLRKEEALLNRVDPRRGY